MTSLRTETKMKSECNVCNDVTVKEECCIWCKAERYSLIILLSSTFFWVMTFL